MIKALILFRVFTTQIETFTSNFKTIPSVCLTSVWLVMLNNHFIGLLDITQAKELGHNREQILL